MKRNEFNAESLDRDTMGYHTILNIISHDIIYVLYYHTYIYIYTYIYIATMAYNSNDKKPSDNTMIIQYYTYTLRQYQ